MGQDMRYPESQHQQSEQDIGQTVEQGRAAEMIETWTNIPGFKGIYQASREGDIRRVYKNGKTRILTPYHKKNERESATGSKADNKRPGTRSGSDAGDCKDILRTSAGGAYPCT